MGRDWSCVGSMTKARKLGWTGYSDTWDKLEETFQVLEKEGAFHLWNSSERISNQQMESHDAGFGHGMQCN
jgi:hypothetical protein